MAEDKDIKDKDIKEMGLGELVDAMFLLRRYVDAVEIIPPTQIKPELRQKYDKYRSIQAELDRREKLYQPME